MAADQLSSQMPATTHNCGRIDQNPATPKPALMPMEPKLLLRCFAVIACEDVQQVVVTRIGELLDPLVEDLSAALILAE